MKLYRKVKEECRNHHLSGHCFGERVSRHLCTYMHVVWVRTHPLQLYIETCQYLPTLLVLVYFLSECLYCQLQERNDYFSSFRHFLNSVSFYWHKLLRRVKMLWAENHECCFLGLMLNGMYFSLICRRMTFKHNFKCVLCEWMANYVWNFEKLIPRSSFK